MCSKSVWTFRVDRRDWSIRELHRVCRDTTDLDIIPAGQKKQQVTPAKHLPQHPLFCTLLSLSSQGSRLLISLYSCTCLAHFHVNDNPGYPHSGWNGVQKRAILLSLYRFFAENRSHCVSVQFFRIHHWIFRGHIGRFSNCRARGKMPIHEGLNQVRSVLQLSVLQVI